LKRYQETLTKKAEAAKQLEQQLATYERSLRMPLTQKSHAQEDIPMGFPHVAAEPEPATAAGDD
jgi:hypothetical protein